MKLKNVGQKRTRDIASKMSQYYEQINSNFFSQYEAQKKSESIFRKMSINTLLNETEVIAPPVMYVQEKKMLKPWFIAELDRTANVENKFIIKRSHTHKTFTSPIVPIGTEDTPAQCPNPTEKEGY